MRMMLFKIVFDEDVTLLSQHNIYLTATRKDNKIYMIYCCFKRNLKWYFVWDHLFVHRKRSIFSDIL